MIQLTELTQLLRMIHMSFQIAFIETSGAESLTLVLPTLTKVRGGPPKPPLHDIWGQNEDVATS